jgi:hypothetical protein
MFVGKSHKKSDIGPIKSNTLLIASKTAFMHYLQNIKNNAFAQFLIIQKEHAMSIFIACSNYITFLTSNKGLIYPVMLYVHFLLLQNLLCILQM